MFSSLDYIWVSSVKTVRCITLHWTAFCDMNNFIGPDWLHNRRNEDSSSRSSQGALCNLVPRQTCIFNVASWPLEFGLCGIWTLLPDTLELGWSCWARCPWVGGWELYGEETGPCLSFSDSLFQGSYHFSPPHLLKIAFTFHQQRQSRQDMARAFIFKYSLLPSKSSNWLGNILMEALQWKSRQPK